MHTRHESEKEKDENRKGRVVRTAKDVYLYAEEMRYFKQEMLRALYLDTHHRVIYDKIIFVGVITVELIHPRDIFKPALEYGAAALMLAHNHVSGIVEPTQDDIEITRLLVAAGVIVGIHVLDHVIIGPDIFKSIRIGY